MSHNNAKVHLIGNLVRNPELKQVGGYNVCNFTIAVNIDQKREDGASMSNLYECSLWGRLGELRFQEMQRGTRVSVWGDLKAVTVGEEEKTKLRVRCSDAMILDGTRRREEEEADMMPAETATGSDDTSSADDTI